MMSKILIIYAHPEKESYNREILNRTIEILEKKKANYKVLDLYKMKFNPVLDFKGNTSDVEKIQNDIKESQKLIFIYPIWWGTMPAILKGFCDRVFTPGFGYKYIDSAPKGLLKNKTALVLTTTGSPKIFDLITGDNPAKGLTKKVLRFCGMTTKSCVFNNALKFKEDKERIRKFTEKKVLSFLRK